MTREGAIVGTLQYMAPEQLEGKTADARSDVFALGCVLHEMVTGKRAFEGSSAAAVASSILRADAAPLATLRADAPRGARRRRAPLPGQGPGRALAVRARRQARARGPEGERARGARRPRRVEPRGVAGVGRGGRGRRPRGGDARCARRRRPSPPHRSASGSRPPKGPGSPPGARRPPSPSHPTAARSPSWPPMRRGGASTCATCRPSTPSPWRERRVHSPRSGRPTGGRSASSPTAS